MPISLGIAFRLFRFVKIFYPFLEGVRAAFGTTCLSLPFFENFNIFLDDVRAAYSTT